MSKTICVLAGLVLAVVSTGCGPGESSDAIEAEGSTPLVTIGSEVSSTLDLPTSTVELSASTVRPSTSTSTTSTPTSTGAPTTTSTVPATTTSVGSTTTSISTPGAVCSAGPVPPGDETAHVQLDVNGDGTLEVAYAVRYELVWMLILEFADGQYASMPVVDAELFDNVRVVGGVRFRGDKSDDIALTIGGGAYTQVIGFARAADCDLERLVMEDGSPATFLSGASIANFSGVRCGTGLVEQYFFSLSGEDADGSPMFEGGFTPYNLSDLTFVEFPSDAAILTLAELQEIPTFDCFDLTL